MVDIEMCTDKQCPSRESCYRFKAKADAKWQTYAAFERQGDDKCDDYWPMSHIYHIERLQTVKVEAADIQLAEIEASNLPDSEWSTLGIMEVRKVE